MLIQATVEKMNAMKLSAMAEAFECQLASSEYAELNFEERVGLMVDTEWTARENRKLARRLRGAKMRHAACIEDINFKAPRGLNRQQLLSLGSCAWVGARHNLIVIGPTGIGKSYLGCAFVERACRKGFNAQYARAPRLLHELAVGRGDGSYTRLLARLAKLDLLAIDDWLLAPLKEPERRDLMEVIEDRAERASTLIASQLPIKDWHAVIGDPNQADALCDRLLHNAHRIELKGPSMRQTRTAPKEHAGQKEGTQCADFGDGLRVGKA
jgi:DNA replication protein DnaC